ncbi:hypothetical protein Salmuc_00589 [Salipiger mucosus DSM 16094]|uniref:Uncharacterized protein n=1 Tax=Salipiger mucosus DSM 16094 TaxID=1123237 RepID=S9QZG0_9RHOB|nr:hypothetical protein Salmuc_00589 [Salipiger mucosus DSM 16094]
MIRFAGKRATGGGRAQDGRCERPLAFRVTTVLLLPEKQPGTSS